MSKQTHGCDTGRYGVETSNGKYISLTGLKADNLENPVFIPSNLEISAARRLYRLLKDIGPAAAEISRKGGSYMDGVAGHIRLTHMEGNGSPGIENQEDGLERKTGFCLCMRRKQTKIEVLTASSIQTRWERLSSFAL